MKAISWLIAILLTYGLQSGFFLQCIAKTMPKSSQQLEHEQERQAIADKTLKLIRYHYDPKTPQDNQLNYCLRWSGYNANPSVDVEMLNSIHTCIEGKFGEWREIIGK